MSTPLIRPSPSTTANHSIARGAELAACTDLIVYGEQHLFQTSSTFHARTDAACSSTHAARVPSTPASERRVGIPSPSKPFACVGLSNSRRFTLPYHGIHHSRPPGTQTTETLQPPELYVPIYSDPLTHEDPSLTSSETYLPMPVAMASYEFDLKFERETSIKGTDIKFRPGERLAIATNKVNQVCKAENIPRYCVLGDEPTPLTAGSCVPNFVLDTLVTTDCVGGIPVEVARYNHEKASEMAPMIHNGTSRASYSTIVITDPSDVKTYPYSICGVPGHRKLIVNDSVIRAAAQVMGMPAMAEKLTDHTTCGHRPSTRCNLPPLWGEAPTMSSDRENHDPAVLYEDTMNKARNAMYSASIEIANKQESIAKLDAEAGQLPPFPHDLWAWVTPLSRAAELGDITCLHEWWARVLTSTISSIIEDIATGWTSARPPATNRTPIFIPPDVDVLHTAALRKAENMLSTIIGHDNSRSDVEKCYRTLLAKRGEHGSSTASGAAPPPASTTGPAAEFIESFMEAHSNLTIYQGLSDERTVIEVSDSEVSALCEALPSSVRRAHQLRDEITPLLAPAAWSELLEVFNIMVTNMLTDELPGIARALKVPAEEVPPTLLAKQGTPSGKDETLLRDGILTTVVKLFEHCIDSRGYMLHLWEYTAVISHASNLHDHALARWEDSKKGWGTETERAAAEAKADAYAALSKLIETRDKMEANVRDLQGTLGTDDMHTPRRPLHTNNILMTGQPQPVSSPSSPFIGGIGCDPGETGDREKPFSGRTPPYSKINRMLEHARDEARRMGKHPIIGHGNAILPISALPNPLVLTIYDTLKHYEKLDLIAKALLANTVKGLGAAQAQEYELASQAYGTELIEAYVPGGLEVLLQVLPYSLIKIFAMLQVNARNDTRPLTEEFFRSRLLAVAVTVTKDRRPAWNNLMTIVYDNEEKMNDLGLLYDAQLTVSAILTVIRRVPRDHYSFGQRLLNVVEAMEDRLREVKYDETTKSHEAPAHFNVKDISTIGMPNASCGEAPWHQGHVKLLIETVKKEDKRLSDLYAQPTSDLPINQVDVVGSPPPPLAPPHVPKTEHNSKSKPPLRKLKHVCKYHILGTEGCPHGDKCRWQHPSRKVQDIQRFSQDDIDATIRLLKRQRTYFTIDPVRAEAAGLSLSDVPGPPPATPAPVNAITEAAAEETVSDVNTGHILHAFTPEQRSQLAAVSGAGDRKTMMLAMLQE